MDTKYCPRCEQALPVADFSRATHRRDGLAVYCAACYRALNKDTRQRLKLAAFAHLGGVCSRCGFADVRALQIDHKNGDGAARRKELSGDAVFKDVVKPHGRERYQLLCANCNWIKMWEQGERGSRTYTRMPPLEERIVRANRRWTPEMRAEQAAQARERWADPEKRKRMTAGRSERMKARWAAGEIPNKKRERPEG